jgi:hypothetical protein
LGAGPHVKTQNESNKSSINDTRQNVVPECVLGVTKLDGENFLLPRQKDP